MRGKYYSWEAKLSIFSRYISQQTIMILGLSLLLVFVLNMAMSAGRVGFVDMLKFFSIIGGIIVTFILISVLLLAFIMYIRSGSTSFWYRYVISESGIAYKDMTGLSKQIGAIGLVGGVLTGSLSQTYLGWLNRSEADMYIEWRDIKDVKERKAYNIYELKNKLGRPVMIKCSKENYDIVGDLINLKLNGERLKNSVYFKDESYLYQK